jgi:hypothetical protein
VEALVTWCAAGLTMADGDANEGLSAKQREELLRSGWMYHDYLWFKYTMRSHGPDDVNRPNRQILFDMARAEMMRLMRALGVSRVGDAETVFRLLNEAGDLYVGNLAPMKVETGDGWFRLSTNTCFVHVGTQRDGLTDHYQCGPMTRVSGWLSAMRLKYDFEPGIGLCLPNQGKDCRYTIKFQLPM